jgi:hypothetical protein
MSKFKPGDRVVITGSISGVPWIIQEVGSEVTLIGVDLEGVWYCKTENGNRYAFEKHIEILSVYNSPLMKALK